MAMGSVSETNDLQNAPFRDRKRLLEDRVGDLMARLTLEEKVTLLAGAEAFALAPIARLKVPSLRVTDGPTGVRSNEGRPATIFPVGIAMAATWNPELAFEVGAAIGREAAALGAHVVLAPTINIIRTPLWGRNFETYSEDPYLAGQMGIGFVNGVQSEGVGTSLKHFAANNQEHNRFRVSAEIDERTLRENYLAAFEMVVKRARPWTVMASYNRIGGVYATENRRLLTDILKTEWGYDGAVVSDWGAVHSTAAAANAGNDLEMPGPPRHFGARLLQAVSEWSVSERQIDDNARRVVRLIVRSGAVDGTPPPAGELTTPRHRAIALRAAEESIVLLKNEGALLPLNPEAIKSLAVIGPNADLSRVQGGGSSRVARSYFVTPLGAIRQALGDTVEIRYAQGVDSEPVPPVPRSVMFSVARDGAERGLGAEYFAAPDFSGEPIRAEVERRFEKLVGSAGIGGAAADYAALRWRGFFWPQKSGTYELSICGPGSGAISLDGQTIVDSSTPGETDPYRLLGGPATRRTVAAELAGGAPVAIQIDYALAGDPLEVLSIGVRQPAGTIEEAVAVARGADATILVVGSSSKTESEGYDRESLELPGNQNELARAVLAANPRTVVVLNAGAPMTMPWLESARAVLAAWLPGQEGPHAIANVVFGKINPSGRLPVTFPKRLQDDPSYLHYPGAHRAIYGEGLFVGYRYYDKREVEPMFAFGHGLSYTKFEYSELRCPQRVRASESIDIAVSVRNLGERAGSETVQIFVEPSNPPEVRPLRELKGFRKIELAAGEKGIARITLDARAFAFYDADLKDWIVAPGDYEVIAGASSRDLRLRATIRLDAEADPHS
jgi:beta-glucosidase